jgi:hypothetical protein
MILYFWDVLPPLRDGSVKPKVLKKLLSMIIEEHKPPIPSECTSREQKNLVCPGASVPKRYRTLLDILGKTGIMGFSLKDPIDLMVGLLFGTLNSQLVVNLMQALQEADLSNEDEKRKYTCVLLFLAALMRNTILVKSPIMLYQFITFLIENFNSDTGIVIDSLSAEDFSSEFKDGLKIVFVKVFADFKKLPSGKPLSAKDLSVFKAKIAELSVPEGDDCKSRTSQFMADIDIPTVLTESHGRHMFAVQELTRRLLLADGGDTLFEFNNDFSEDGPFFLFLSLLTSTCRKSSTILQKEFEKVMASLKKAIESKEKRCIHSAYFFGKEFEKGASKFFALIRLVFLSESDAFIAQFFCLEKGKKTMRNPSSLKNCVASLYDKMNENAKFSKPVQVSMRSQIMEVFPFAKFATDISDTPEEGSRPAAGGGECAKPSSFQPARQLQQQSATAPPKSALKQQQPVSASAFTASALSAHTADQAKLANILHAIGLTSPDGSMNLASKFMEAGISDLKSDLLGLSKEDIIETLKCVTVILTPVQLKKLMTYVSS